MTAEFRLSVCRTLGEPTGIDDRLAWLEKTLGDAFEMIFDFRYFIYVLRTAPKNISWTEQLFVVLKLFVLLSHYFCNPKDNPVVVPIPKPTFNPNPHPVPNPIAIPTASMTPTFEPALLVLMPVFVSVLIT